MNLNSFFKKIINEERGIATVLTIGVLALLAALAIGFLSESMILQKISNNNLNLERSRLLAQSMVQRTIAAVTQYNATTSDSLITFNSQRLLKGVNGTDTDDAPDTDDLATSLSTTFNNIEYFTWDEDASDSPQWQYIRTTRNTDGDSMLVGRIAYVVINNIGKLDPSAIVDSGSNASPAITEDTDLYTGIDPGEAKVIGRPGRDVREIFAKNINSDITTGIQQLMSAENAAPVTGALTEGTRWFDISEFIGAVGVGNTTSDTQIRTNFNNWFFTDNPAEPEAFWIDIDADDIIEQPSADSELFHRFNLTRTDWDDITVVSMLGVGLDPDTVAFNPNSTNNDYTDASVLVIPWLKNWKNAGGMGSATNAKNQIIANLIDYCDSDDSATTDDQDNPTYVGLEKVPYINELTFTLSGQTSLTPAPVSIELTVTDYWEDRFNGLITVTNNTGATINSWNLEFDFPFDITGNYWNANITRSGQSYEVQNKSYNATITPGASTDFGFSSVDHEGTAEEDIPTLLNNTVSGSFYNQAVVKVQQLDLELVNMYNSNITVDAAEITISADCYFSVYNSEVETDSIKIEFDEKTITLFDGITVDADTYRADTYNDNSSLKIIKGITTDNPASKGSISNFNITSLKIKLTTNNRLADFSKIIESSTTSPESIISIGSSGTSTNKYLAFNAQINDSRQNLSSSDWTIAIMTQNDDINTARNDILSTIIGEENPSSTGKNTAFAPDVDGDESDSDYESGATDPWNISTAYIRNAPMKSPWELGFIHRGAAWQTINLKAYNMTEGASPDAGGNGYANGDANVLDQIKMTANTETYGKVNINSTSSTSTPHLNIYTALLQDIYLTGTNSTDKSNYDNPGTQGGTRVNGDIPNNIAVDFVTNSTTTPYKTRAQILRPTNGVTTLHNGTEIAQTNDAAQEEIIGKFINLTTAGTSNNLTLITVAQTIKDVGDVTVTKNGTPIPTEFNRYDENADAILAEQKILVILVRDPITFKWQIKKLRYINL